jgi:hypothetical protein
LVKEHHSITAPDVLAIGKAVEVAALTAARTIREVGLFKHAIRNGLANGQPSATTQPKLVKPHKTVNHSRNTSQQLPKLLKDINAL